MIRQAGFWPLAPSLGTEGMWPGPITGDGLVFDATDPEQSAASLAQTLAMHGTLGDYDDRAGAGREGLLAMPQKRALAPAHDVVRPGRASARRAGCRASSTTTSCRSASPSRTARAAAMGPDRRAKAKLAAALHPHRRRPLLGHRRLAERLRHAHRRRLPGRRSDGAARHHAGDGLLPAPRGADPRELGAARHPGSAQADGRRRARPAAEPSVAGAAPTKIEIRYRRQGLRRRRRPRLHAQASASGRSAIWASFTCISSAVSS